MKFRTLTLIGLILVAWQVSANTIDLAYGYAGQSRHEFLKKIRDGESIQFNFLERRPQYVESILISAEGKQNAYSFGKVFVDGVEIATLGIPGRDPLYPIVVRERVSSIEVFATDGSKFKITGFKIYTQAKDYPGHSQHNAWDTRNSSIESFGDQVLNIIYALNDIYSLQTSPHSELYFALIKRAMIVSANEHRRSAGSLKTFQKVRGLLKVITQVEKLLLSNGYLQLDRQANDLIMDLMAVKIEILQQ